MSNPDSNLCTVCRNEMPPKKLKGGSRRLYCSQRCTSRAYNSRRKDDRVVTLTPKLLARMCPKSERRTWSTRSVSLSLTPLNPYADIELAYLEDKQR